MAITSNYYNTVNDVDYYQISVGGNEKIIVSAENLNNTIEALRK